MRDLPSPVSQNPVSQNPVLQTQLCVLGRASLIEGARERLRGISEVAAVRRSEGEGSPRFAVGLNIDVLVDDLLHAGGTGVFVRLGDVVRVAGDSPDGTGWLVEVCHPLGHFAAAVLRLDRGAVATVARAPGAVSDGLRALSVVADQAWQAELVAGAALAAGPRGAVPVLESAGVSALVMDDADETHPVGNWEALSAARRPLELLGAGR